MINQPQHIPVLKDAVLGCFKDIQGTFLDATFGGGGHTKALLEQNKHIYIIGLDTDPDAILRAKDIRRTFPPRFQFFHCNFSHLKLLCREFDGILMDLGVSSFQLDQAQRGFSFQHDGPLDMRMNSNEGMSAKTFLETGSEGELVKAIRDFGEEPQWRSVVKQILSLRHSASFETTFDLVNFLLEHTSLRRSKKPGIHPATRVFQGIRIYINQELDHLQSGLTQAFACLNPNGILAVITFHSLEDRIVKQFFNEKCGKSLHCLDAEPRQFKQAQASLIFKKPIVADDNEINSNPRSRSAKLRAIRKIL
ncbi:MAG: 16S rRNA (cytosine(1402)-N(4))-methyltransferase RsmH [Puniceicoccales bacterium]|jgi:16S rRNA (cytosine1402-N4)-methyltransferase|nr:16S rRNA (cytosine(1402)-N(4))-methyltransferase RsmH [Puniceicoccales bacterium]